MSWLNLEGKTVIVTGGASGIGAAVVDEFLNQGCNVVVSDLSEKETDNEKLLYVKCDVTKRSDVKNVVSKTLEKFGNIDILVNNAGINIPRLLVDKNNPESKYEFTDEVYDKIMDINVKGLFIFSQEVGRILVKNGKGVIVNMSSESGLEGSEGQSIYAASKNAVNSLTRSWAKELGKLGVRVVGVAPGNKLSKSPEKCTVKCPRSTRFFSATSPTPRISNRSPSTVRVCPTSIFPFVGRTSIL